MDQKPKTIEYNEETGQLEGVFEVVVEERKPLDLDQAKNHYNSLNEKIDNINEEISSLEAKLEDCNLELGLFVNVAHMLVDQDDSSDDESNE